MPFIAVCPHCRVRLRAPRAKRGKAMPCPKCEHIFTLRPHDDGSGVETAPTDQGETAPAATAVGAPVEAAADDPLLLAKVSLGALAVVLVLSQFPYGRAIAALVATVGAVVGVQALLDWGKRAWPGGVGVVLNAALLIILVGYPATLGVKGWWPTPGEGKTEATAALPGIDAGDAAWEHGGVRVAVTFANVGPERSSVGAGTKERFLWIGVKLTNLSAGCDIEFSGWRTTGPSTPALTTLDQTPVATQRFLGPSGKVSLRQGNFVECLLVFDVPPPGQDLLLDLPTEPFGDTGLIRFRIPHDLIAKQ